MGKIPNSLRKFSPRRWSLIFPTPSVGWIWLLASKEQSVKREIKELYREKSGKCCLNQMTKVSITDDKSILYAPDM